MVKPSEKGMGNKASYFVQWKIIQWLKEAGYHYYDLNGINPARNPGTYHFKAGIAGKAGRDVDFLGHYDSFKGLRGRIISACGDVVFFQLNGLRRRLGVVLSERKNEVNCVWNLRHP